MELAYAYTPKNEAKAAKAMGRDLNVSFKDAVVVSDLLRGMYLPAAMQVLELVIAKEKPVPYRRYRKGVGHRKGAEGAAKIGKYPVKAAQEVLNVLRNIESNAEYKGLDAEDLKITHIQTLKGISRLRRRPKGRWRMWTTQFVHIQAVAEEKPRKEAVKKKPGKTEVKTEATPAATPSSKKKTAEEKEAPQEEVDATVLEEKVPTAEAAVETPKKKAVKKTPAKKKTAKKTAEETTSQKKTPSKKTTNKASKKSSSTQQKDTKPKSGEA